MNILPKDIFLYIICDLLDPVSWNISMCICRLWYNLIKNYKYNKKREEYWTVTTVDIFDHKLRYFNNIANGKILYLDRYYRLSSQISYDLPKSFNNPDLFITNNIKRVLKSKHNITVYDIMAYNKLDKFIINTLKDIKTNILVVMADQKFQIDILRIDYNFIFIGLPVFYQDRILAIDNRLKKYIDYPYGFLVVDMKTKEILYSLD